MPYVNKRPTLDRFHIDLNNVQMSKKWFDAQIKKMSKAHITPSSLLMKDGITDLRSKLIPGQLYFYYYDPKYKETLPYYDQFPLVFPYQATPEGFIGLNLHYMGYQERIALFKELLKINGGNLDHTTKLKYQWSTIASMSKVPSAKNCIKQYLIEHVKSQYFKVQPADWTTAMMLPVERFVGASKEQVWRNSRK